MSNIVYDISTVYLSQLRDKENIEKIKNPLFCARSKPSNDIIERRFHTSKWFWFGFSGWKRSFFCRNKTGYVVCALCVLRWIDSFFFIVYTVLGCVVVVVDEMEKITLWKCFCYWEKFSLFGCVEKHILFNRKDVIKEIENSICCSLMYAKRSIIVWNYFRFSFLRIIRDFELFTMIEKISNHKIFEYMSFVIPRTSNRNV